MTQWTEPTANMAPSGSATFSDVVADSLRTDIVSGAWAPEVRLGMKDLCARYAMGMSPIREALHRLVGEGFVQFSGQRGFRVPALSLEDIEDLTLLRELTEEAAVRQAIARGSDAWEAGIVAAFHRYELQVRRMGDFSGFDDKAIRLYDAAHRDFHTSLYVGVVSPRVAALHRNLFDQAYRYRKTLHSPPSSTKRAIAVHRDLMDRVLSRDPEAAVAALHAHLRTTRDATARALGAAAGPAA